MGTFVNSKDPDEMPHNAAFCQGLHCLLRPKQTSEKEILIYFEIIACDPLMSTMNHINWKTPSVYCKSGNF